MYLRIIKFAILSLTINIAYGQIGDWSDTCDDSSECINVENCKVLVDQTVNEKSIHSPIYQHLKSIKCGHTLNSVKVCCPKAGATIRNPVGTAPTRGSISNDISMHKNYNLLPTKCGEWDPTDRVSKGNKTGLYQYPWMVQLIYKKADTTLEPQCGGTMINNRYVLTAAHCVLERRIRSTKLEYVRVGEHDTLTDPDCVGPKIQRECAERYADMSIDDIISHQDYSSSSYRNDIALIRLKNTVTGRKNFLPVCLPYNSDLINNNLFNKSSIITGWGLTENQTVSTSLLQISVAISSDDVCKKRHQLSTRAGIGDDQMCAGGPNNAVTCNGDSGGPLHVHMNINNDDILIQYGVVSYGHITCGTETPAVFTKVANYMNWILDKMQN